jgi:hypothetical protein
MPRHHSLCIHKCILSQSSTTIYLLAATTLFTFIQYSCMSMMFEQFTNLLGRGTKLNHELVLCLCPVGRRLHIRPNARKEGRSGRKTDARTEIPGPRHKQRVISNIVCIPAYIHTATLSLKAYYTTTQPHALLMSSK